MGSREPWVLSRRTQTLKAVIGEKGPRYLKAMRRDQGRTTKGPGTPLHVCTRRATGPRFLLTGSPHRIDGSIRHWQHQAPQPEGRLPGTGAGDRWDRAQCQLQPRHSLPGSQRGRFVLLQKLKPRMRDVCAGTRLTEIPR